jgi:hypothetical protein
MKRKVATLAVIVAALLAPWGARDASACGQCQEQAIINAVRCMGSGPFWLC